MKLTFSGSVPVRRTMVFEKLFHPNLALSYKDKLDTMKEQSVKDWLFVNGKLAGESYGFRPKDGGEEIQGMKYAQWDDKTLYVYSTAILTEFQGKGLSKILKAHFLGKSKGAGFSRIIGHCLEGPSTVLNEGFGASILCGFSDWYGTGQTAHLYQLFI